MIQVSTKRGLRLGAGIYLGLMISGCLSMQNQPSLEAIQKFGARQEAHPFVEAYIEFRGPQEKWAGPANFLLHVVAKEAGAARITVTPPVFGASRLSVVQKGAVVVQPSVSPGMSGEVARNQLNALALAAQGGDDPFQGCLSPVRLRLIRADGAVVEKQGCRGQKGWPKTASEGVSRFIAAAINPS